MQSAEKTVVVLGTGGTIAGTAISGSAEPSRSYLAAQLGVDVLTAHVATFTSTYLETEQVCQVDSKDMSFALWRTLTERVAHHLARTEVQGVVITHGTDTLEETAYFLQRVLAPRKPVVLAAAMRPATALLSDGPQNLLDAVLVASSEQAHGVVAVLAGQVHSGLQVRKVHSHRLTAFSSGDAGVVAQIHEGRLQCYRAWPQSAANSRAWDWQRLPEKAVDWPWVEIISSHAGADARTVQALLQMGVKGMVVAGTGNGTVHCDLEAALEVAQAQGVRVWRSSRCLSGTVNLKVEACAPAAQSLTPCQARVELMLSLLP